MSLTLTDYPMDVSIEKYIDSIRTMTARLKKLPGIISIFHVGAINAPGISDIDMMAVFEDDVMIPYNLLTSLTGKEKYLFVHGLFGTSKRFFLKSDQYLLNDTNKLLWGSMLVSGTVELSEEDRRLIGRQRALEYLLRLYISLTISLKYKVLKIRGLLLQIHAARFDMDLLGIEGGDIHNMILKVAGWRKNWFLSPPHENELITWLTGFYKVLEKFLSDFLKGTPLFAPQWSSLRMGPNISLKGESELSFKSFGLFPAFRLLRHMKKYSNLMNRLNRFIFNVPIVSEGLPRVIYERFCFLRDAEEFNRKRLPYFISTPNGLRCLYRSEAIKS